MLTKKQLELINNKNITNFLFLDDDNNYIIKYLENNFKNINILDVRKGSFKECLTLLNPITKYMNLPSSYNYNKLCDIEIKSLHKFKLYLKDYFELNDIAELENKNYILILINRSV